MTTIKILINFMVLLLLYSEKFYQRHCCCNIEQFSVDLEDINIKFSCFSRRLSTRPTAQELRERNILKCKHMVSFFSWPFFFYKINILGQLFVNEV